MIRQTFILFVFLISPFLEWAQSNPQTSSTTPLSIGEIVTLSSEILDEKRVLNIYLPHGYSADSSKTYPVIYLLDGSINEDFLHISGLVQFGSFPWINMVPESILVGISNVDRKRDFTFPTTIKADKESFPTTGHSAEFISFIEKELQPFIQKQYHTNEQKTLIGQSLGGLLATEILFKNPDLFDCYIIVSPSLWWGNESLLALNPALSKKPKSVYIAVGEEGKIMKKDARALYKKLQKNKPVNAHYQFDFLKGYDHANILHQAVYHAFQKTGNK